MKIALYAMMFIASIATAVHLVLPYVREHNTTVKNRDQLKRDNSELEQKIATIRKYRTEFQNNNLDFIILTGHREGLLGPNDQIFEFTAQKEEK